MKLETRSLELVLSIAQHGTMTRAARHVHLTQSALSHHLLQLEARLRVQLFHRLGRRMLPTPAGERLVGLARRVLPELLEAEDALRAEAEGRAALIRLSTECYTCYHWLPRVLRPFRRRFPTVEVQIIPDATDAPLEALLESRLDLAIIHSEAALPGVRTSPLFTDELVVVTAPDHPLATRRQVSAEDLRAEHVILYAVANGAASVARAYLAGEGVTPRRLSSLPLTEAILEMVKAGLGVTILSRWAVEPQLACGTITVARVGEGGLYRHWQAALTQREVPAHLEHFIELLAWGPAVLESSRESLAAAAYDME